MAVIHQADLVPSKLELLEAWVPTQPWGASGLDVVGAYRFDDPAGAVGIETHILRAGDRLVQVPLTYRAEPLAVAAAHLIDTMQHSVLGTRWVYDACGDPVYAQALAAALVAGAPQALLEYQLDDGTEIREPSVRVHALNPGGDPPTITTLVAVTNPTATVLESGEARFTVLRVLGTSGGAGASGPTLVGTWDGTDEPVELARVG